jgi:phage gp29-like protein
MEQVQAGVRRWAEEVERRRPGSSLEDQALAAYANKVFEKAADLFKEAAAAALPRFEEARKRRAAADEEERKELRSYLDGVIRQADALQRGFHYSEARIALDEAFRRVDKGRYRAWWIEMLYRRTNASEDEGGVRGC